MDLNEPTQGLVQARRRRLPRCVSREHLEYYDACAPHVGGHTVGLAAQNLGRDVTEGGGEEGEAK